MTTASSLNASRSVVPTSFPFRNVILHNALDAYVRIELRVLAPHSSCRLQSRLSSTMSYSITISLDLFLKTENRALTTQGLT